MLGWVRRWIEARRQRVRIVSDGRRVMTFGTTPQVGIDHWGERACRRMETRRCPDIWPKGCATRPCARFESDDETPWLEST